MTIFVRQNSLKLMELFSTITLTLVRYQMDVLTGEYKSLNLVYKNIANKYSAWKLGNIIKQAITKTDFLQYLL